MVKDAGTSQPDTPADAFISDAVFINDSIVVDYLNSLLASYPELMLDEEETRIIHEAIETGWISGNRAASSGITPATYHEARLTVRESAELRSEIENLKFRTEMADVDNQVLRDENIRLREEAAALNAALQGVRETLARTTDENHALRTTAASLEKRLEAAAAQLDEMIRAREAEMMAAQEPPAPPAGDEMTPEDGLPSAETPEEMIAEVPVTEAEVDRSVIIDRELSEARILLRELNEESSRRVAPPVDTAAADSSGSRLPAVQPASPTRVIFTGKDTAARPEPPRSTSKIIKLGAAVLSPPVEVVQSPPVSVTTTHPPQLESASPGTPPVSPPPTTAPRFAPPPPLELSVDQENTPDTPGQRQQLNSDDIDVEPAPTPEVIIRRTVKSYEALQQEGDAIKASRTGRDENS